MYGVIERQEELAGQSWPFEKDVLAGVILDAKFSCIGSTPPVLQRVIGGTSVTIVLKRDGEEKTTVLQPGINFVEGLNYRGVIIVAQLDGKIVPNRETSANFHPATVTSIPMTDRLWSLSGKTGDISLIGSEGFTVTNTGQTISFDTVTLPRSVKTEVQLPDTQHSCYGITDQRKLCRVGITTSSLIVLGTLDRSYKSCVATPNGRLLALQGSDVYWINEIPGRWLFSLPTPCTSLVVIDNQTMYALGSYIYRVDLDTLVVTELGLLQKGVIPLPCVSDATIGNSTNELWYVAKLRKDSVLVTYNISTGEVGELQPRLELKNIYLGVKLNPPDTHPLGLLNHATGLKMYVRILEPEADPDDDEKWNPVDFNTLTSVDSVTGYCTVESSSNYVPNIGNLVSLFQGRDSVVKFNNFKALKTINGKAPESGNIALVGNEVVRFTQTGTDEITIQTVGADNLNGRSQAFSNVP
jgi:hypothetical protein